MSEALLSRRSSVSSSSSTSQVSWARHTWEPHALPSTPNFDGRPIWEPPTLSYSYLTDPDADTKRREAVMEYTDNDIVKTTAIIDIFTELELLDDYLQWATEAHRVASRVDDETASFFQTLRFELYQDLREVQMEDAGGLRQDPREMDIGQWVETEMGRWEQMPTILKWNYEFRANPDGTWAFIGPWEIGAPASSPVESLKGEEEMESEDKVLLADTPESREKEEQRQYSGPEACEERDALSGDIDAEAPSRPEDSLSSPSMSLPSISITSTNALHPTSQHLTTPGLHLRLQSSHVNSPVTTQLALRPQPSTEPKPPRLLPTTSPSHASSVFERRSLKDVNLDVDLD